MTDLGLYLAEWAAWPEDGSRQQGWLRANESFRTSVLVRFSSAIAMAVHAELEALPLWLGLPAVNAA